MQQRVGFARQEGFGGERCWESLKTPSFNLINLQIYCLIAVHPPWFRQKNSLPRPDTSTLACIGTASSHVPSATAVPPYYPPCVDDPLQYFGTTPATTAPAPTAVPDSTAVKIRPLLRPASEATAVICHASPYAESKSAYIDPNSAPTAPALFPDHLDSDPFLAVAMATSLAIQRSPCLNSFLTGKQRPTLPPPHQPPQVIWRHSTTLPSGP